MRKLHHLVVIIVLLPFFITCSDDPNRSPTIQVVAIPLTGFCPLAVQFIASASDPDGHSLTFFWDFGDGVGYSEIRNPVYTYLDAGTFTATCTVTDNGKPRLSASDSLEITAMARVPVLTSIKPGWKVTHMPEFTLTVYGNHFLPSSLILFNGEEKQTTHVGAHRLTCRITPEDTLIDISNDKPTARDETVQVLVRNRSPGGGDSDPLPFIICANHTFSEPQIIASNSSENHLILLKGENLYAIWQPGQNGDRIMRVSQNDGKNWSEEKTVAHSTHNSHFDLTAHENNLYQAVLNSKGDAYFRKSVNNGETWSELTLIAAGTPDSGGIEYQSQDPNILCMGNGRIYTAWMESGNENGEFHDSRGFHSYSDDDGQTWSSPLELPEITLRFALYPRLHKTGSDTIHYYYATGYPSYLDLFCYSFSSDAGDNWSSTVYLQQLEWNEPFFGANGGIYIVDFYFSPHFQTGYFYMGISLDNAQSWSGTTIITFGFGQWAYYWSLVVDSVGNIHFFYSSGGIYYMLRSIDDGDTWAEPVELPLEGYKCYRTSFSVDSAGNIYTFCQKLTSPYPCYFLRSERDE